MGAWSVKVGIWESEGRILTRIKPMLFNTDMVQAIRNGRKTVTRRLIMPHNRKKAKEQGYVQGSGLWIDPRTDNGDKEGHIKDYSISSCWMSYGLYAEKYADYKPGDILYVREKWCKNPTSGEYYYAANRKRGADAPYGLKWHPSIHMPEEAARIWLRVKDVRIEQLCSMDLDDFLSEGVCIRPEAFSDPENAHMQAKDEFIELWNSTISKGQQNLYGWTANPWVWAIEFEQCERPKR